MPHLLIWLRLFEHGHFQEELQIKNSIILLQRHLRKDSFFFSHGIIHCIYFNSPSSFFLFKKKKNKMKKVEYFFFFSVENTVFHNIV